MNTRPRLILSASLASVLLSGGMAASNASTRTAQEILAGAALHCDAADTNTLMLDASGNVTNWGAASPATGCNLPQYKDGWVDFGDTRSNRDMVFPRIDDVQTFIQVIDIQTTMDAFLLGDSNKSVYQFCRGEKGEYCHDHNWKQGSPDNKGWAADRFKYGSFWNNGVKVEQPGYTVIPAGPCVISFTAGEGDKKLTSDSLTSGNNNTTPRIGGRRLAEVAIFTDKLSDADREIVERHLLTKWKLAVKTWKGGDGLWGTASQWEPETCEDGFPTLFPADGDGTVGVDTDAAVKSLKFKGGYTLTNAGGSIVLGGPVTVAEGKTAAILAPVSGALDKRGAGLLVLDLGTDAGPGPSSYSFSGPATVRDGTVAKPVTLAAGAELTITNAALQAGVSGGGKLVFDGTNTLGAGASLSGLSSLAFGAAGLTRITGADVSLGAPGAVTAGDGCALAVEAGAKLSYDYAAGTNLPIFTQLDGAVTVTATLTPEQILADTEFTVATIADGPEIGADKFSGVIVSTTDTALPAVFTVENRVVKMHADKTNFERPLVWAPGIGEGGAVNEGTWISGDESVKLWKTDIAPIEEAFFRDKDSVTFGKLGDGGNLAVVNVSGTVKPGALAFSSAAGGTAYCLRPAAADAKIEVKKQASVSGPVTNRVPWKVSGGLTLKENSRLVMEDASLNGNATIQKGAALVLFASEGAAEQQIPGEMKGGGKIVKEGPGVSRLSSKAKNTALNGIEVNGGTLVFDAGPDNVPQKKIRCVTVASNATLRLGRNSLGYASPSYVITNAGVIETGSYQDFRCTMTLDGGTVKSTGSIKQWGLTSACYNGTLKAIGGKTSYLTAADPDDPQLRHQVENLTFDVDEGSAIVVDVGLMDHDGNPNGAPSLTWGVTKTGPGRTVINRPPVYKGTTVINAGTYEMNAAQTNGGAYTVAAGAVLAGTGSIRSDIELNGTIAATLSCSNITVAAGAKIDATADGSTLAVAGTFAVAEGYEVPVDVTGRALRGGELLISWDEKPACDFELVGTSHSAEKTAAGLRLRSGGTIVIIR